MEYLFFVIPFIVLIQIAPKYLVGMFEKTYPEENYKIFIGAISLTAVLAGLSLRLSNSVENDDIKKKAFYNAGECLVHATLLNSVSIVIQYAASLQKASESPIWFNIPYELLLFASGSLFFIFGMGNLVTGLMMLHKFLFEGTKKYFD